MKNKYVLLLMLLMFYFFQGQAQKILTLEQAMDVAEKNSPTLQSSLFNLDNTTELLYAQRAALKSNFSLSLNPVNYSNSRQFDNRTSTWYTNNKFASGGTFTISQPILPTDGVLALSNNFNWSSNTSSATGAQENRAYLNNLALSLTQPLFTYNRTKVSIKTLELNNENAMLNYAMQRLALEKSVAQYFYNVYLAQMSLRINQDQLANSQQSRDIIKSKVDAGISAQSELYQAEVTLATSQSAVNSARVSLENAKDVFKQYIGMDIFEDLTVAADVEVSPIEVNENKAIEHGLASRMELRQRQISVETALFSMLSVKALNEFRGDMKLSFGYTGQDEILANLYNQPTRSPGVNLTFNIPLYDWGEKKARIRAQEANIDNQKLGVVTEETQIKVDIRQSIRNLSNLKNQINIALVTQNNSQLTYDINLERYKNGDLTSLDLSLYSQQLSSAKMNYAQSMINYKIELLNLKIVSLYDFAKNEPVIPERYIEQYRTSKKKS